LAGPELLPKLDMNDCPGALEPVGAPELLLEELDEAIGAALFKAER
jgi:hypothetical protein